MNRIIAGYMYGNKRFIGKNFEGRWIFQVTLIKYGLYFEVGGRSAINQISALYRRKSKVDFIQGAATVSSSPLLRPCIFPLNVQPS